MSSHEAMRYAEAEIRDLRAALAKAEAERNERKAGNLVFMSQIHKILNRMDPGDPDDGILVRLNRAADRLDSERARAEKAEAELARYPTSAADARICKQQMIEQRARAEKYLAAMEPVSYLDAVVWCDLDLDRCRIEIKWSERQAIRALVQEARRG